jgi:hypothetical protein
MTSFQIKIWVLVLVFYLATGVSITMSCRFDRLYWRLPGFVHNSWTLSTAIVLLTPVLWAVYLPVHPVSGWRSKRKRT